MERAANKAARILQIETLLLAYPEGLKPAEIARKLGGVHRSTITRMLDDLPKHIYVDEFDDGKWKIDWDSYMVNIRLSLHEAMAVHLATRLLAKWSNRRNHHAGAALRKLGISLKHLAPFVSDHFLASAEVMDGEAQYYDPVYLRVLETLTRAWSKKRMVKIKHKKEDTGKVNEYKFAPYFIEPYPLGQTTHVIGRIYPEDIRLTFKLERIRDIEPLDDEPYTIPDDFNPRELLANAWGIWYTDKEPQDVALKFRADPHIVSRVKETRWQSGERTDDLPDGSLWWQAKIDEPREMLPWIRGWGADVEALKPEGLREALIQTALDLGKIYGTTTTTAKLLYHLPYAKTNPDNPKQIHLLLYHLIDVGQVAWLLWGEVLTDSIRQRLAGMLNLSVDEAGQFIAFLAALHDLGKCSPAYQQKYAPDWLKKELVEANFILHDATGYSHKTQDPKTPHATISTWALIALLPELLQIDTHFSYKIAVALGGHHGSWPASGATDNIDDGKYPQWNDVRRDLCWEVRADFHPPTAVKAPANKTDLNTFLTIFSGLVSVADWIGSRNKECFGFIERAMSTRQYALRSVEKARSALDDLGWFGWQPTGHTLDFGQVFAYLNFTAPRGVQAEVINQAQHLAGPSLLIVEAPTGIGKTEIALYVADSWLQQQAGRGLYVAMPTQATSNQMYGRVGEFLHHRYPHTKINYHLVHGQAAWQDKFKKQIELQTVGDDKRTTAVQAESWFTPRKQTLLAPFGVGTVDQTFMSILQTKHFFVRLFGLSHKVIIFDEVHAYDTFMSTLFERLLTWLNAVGTSVIILSATLPAETRRKLVKAYSGETLTQSGEYPSLTIAAANQTPRLIELPKPADITVQLAWDVGREPDDILTYLKEELAAGGCAAVICNTVRRAQEIYKVLDEARQNGDLDLPQDDLILFHARFPPVWRQVIEEKVLRKFGKPDKEGKSPHRPHKGIVVATQVIEQSLDLDFDLMLTDPAPIDLIIQRAGRLHRHDRTAAERYGLPRRLVITEPT
ncbi:MAG: CRISPR-associated helicase Cas3', partial [Anaerolineae bacterium]|nr:CRISPR-associated helicase Cas3' [Anaerolineae bacterium]